MRKSLIKFAAIALTGSCALSACVGSFRLTNKVLEWNQGLGDKFVNEIVFIGLNILPVYEVTVVADAVVLNAIEFWTGSNPIAEAGTVRKVKGSDGMMYTIKTLKDGYEITNADGEVMNFIHNDDDDSWRMENNGHTVILFCYNGDGTVDVSTNGDETMTVALNEEGILAYEAATNYNNCIALN